MIKRSFDIWVIERKRMIGGCAGGGAGRRDELYDALRMRAKKVLQEDFIWCVMVRSRRFSRSMEVYTC